MSKTDSKDSDRRPVARALWLLNRLLRDGGTLTVAEAATIMGVNVARARPVVRTILEQFEPATRGALRQESIRLVGVRSGEPDHEVAIAASLGAAAADLFHGTALQVGMKKALGYVISASTNADKFKNLDRKFFFVRRSGERALPQNAAMLERIAGAVIDQRPLRIAYTKFNGDLVRKETIEPLSIAIHEHQIYVIAKRRRDESLRTYRFSRFKDVQRTGASFKYPEPDDFDPPGLFRDSFGIFLGTTERRPVDVRLRLSTKWKHYATCQRWHESQDVTQRDDGVELRLHLRICDELKMWIQSFGPDAEVLEPAVLREEMSVRARDLAALYVPDDRFADARCEEERPPTSDSDQYSGMAWTPLTFGKHKGKTLPQVLFSDPDWFFWAMSDNVFRNKHSTVEVATAARRARSIAIPQTQAGVTLVAEYVVHSPTRKFGGVEFVPEERPHHEGSATSRLPYIDLSVPKTLANYDKKGAQLLLGQIRPKLFPGVKRLTRKRLDEFFDDASNFDDP